MLYIYLADVHAPLSCEGLLWRSIRLNNIFFFGRFFFRLFVVVGGALLLCGFCVCGLGKLKKFFNNLNIHIERIRMTTQMARSLTRIMDEFLQFRLHTPVAKLYAAQLISAHQWHIHGRGLGFSIYLQGFVPLKILLLSIYFYLFFLHTFQTNKWKFVQQHEQFL